MAKFKLFWENNPKTPLEAGRLSGFIDYYTDDTLIYSDDQSILPNGDGGLKIKSLSKVGLINHETIGALEFDKSLVTFNSKFAPIENRGLVFRDEYYRNKGSLSFDTPIQNIITNPGFEEDGLDWVFETDPGLGSSIQYTTSDFYPILNGQNLKSARILTGEVYGLSKLTKTIDTSSIDSSISLTFYYKSSDDFYFILKTGTLDNQMYWNDVTWVGTENRYNLESSDEWKRVEISQIYTNNVDTISLEFYIAATNGEFYLDSFLVENKPYCSSFYFEETESSTLSYNNGIINYEKGLIDFNFFPRHITDQTFFSLKTNIPGDAIRLDFLDNKFLIYFYDSINRDYEVFEHIFPYSLILDKWARCSLSWDFNTKKVMFFVGALPGESEELFVDESKIHEYTLSENFGPFKKEDLRDFYIGSNGGLTPFRGLVEFFKINSNSLDKSDLLLYLNNYSQIDLPRFKLFENQNKSILLKEDLLDVGSFTPSTKYIVWVCDNNDDSAEIVISKNSIAPLGYGWFNSKVIGGFYTDSDNNIDLTSIWDISTREKSLVLDRVLIGDTRLQKIEDTLDNQKLTPVEIKTRQGDDYALFNIDTTFTQSLFGKNRNDDNFFHLNSNTGELFLDDLHFDSHTITSIDTDLELFAGVNTLYLHSHEVNLQSEGTDVKIDDLRILDSTLYSKDGQDLIINTKFAGNNNLSIITDVFTTEALQQDVNITNNFTIETGGDFSVLSDKIALNGIKIDNNVISSENLIHLTSNLSSVQIELLKFNQDKMFYGDESKRFIRFYEDLSNPDLENIDIVSDNLVKIDSPRFEVTSDQIIFHASMTNYFRLEDIRVENNKIFTESGTNLLLGGQGTELSDNVSISSRYNININSPNINLSVDTMSMFSTESLVLNDIRIVDSTIDTINDKTLFLGNDVSQIKMMNITEFVDNIGIRVQSPPTDLFIYNESGSTIALDSLDNRNVNINLVTKSFNGETNLGNSNTKGWSIIGRGDQWSQASERNSIQLGYWDSTSWAHPFTFTSSALGIKTNNPQYALDVHGHVRIHDNKLYLTDSVGLDSFSLYKNNDDFVLESASGVVDIKNPTKIPNLSIGSSTGTQSNFQSISSQTNSGFIQTPWMYVSGGIESNERDSSGTGIFFHDGYFNTQTDQINFVTGGISRVQIQNDGHIRLGSSGTLYPGNETPTNDGWLTYHGDFKAYRVYNAVWMDLAECWYKDDNYEFDYGMVVVQTENGIRPIEKRAEKGSVGVISNTYGYLLNSEDFDSDNFKESKSLPVAISGRVNTKFTGKLGIGDEVVGNKDGGVIRASFIEKIIFRDRILGRVDSVSGSNCMVKVY